MGDAGGGIPDSYWKALFKFSQTTGAEQWAQSDHAPPRAMADEDRKWLEGAMKELVASSDPVRLMGKQIQLILDSNPKAPDEAQMETIDTACDALDDLLCDIDNSNDFYTIGGGKALVALLGSNEADCRAYGASLIGAMVQNNERCQNRLLEAGMLDVLLELVENGSSDKARAKAMFAISCFLRAHVESQKQFLALNGYQKVSVGLQRITALSKESVRFLTKTAFLVTQMAKEETNTHKDALLSSDVLIQLLRLVPLMNQETPSLEHTLEAILAIGQLNPDVLRKNAESGILTEHLKLLLKETSVEHEELQQTMRSILKILGNTVD